MARRYNIPQLTESERRDYYLIMTWMLRQDGVPCPNDPPTDEAVMTPLMAEYPDLFTDADPD